MSGIEKMIDSACPCVKCGRGMQACRAADECWDFCSCGYIIAKGKTCHNPKTEACSVKVKHRVYNRRTKRCE